MPLPPEQLITRLDPVADEVIWLTTDRFTLPGTVPGGQLYRSADDGAHWNRVLVDGARPAERGSGAATRPRHRRDAPPPGPSPA